MGGTQQQQQQQQQPQAASTCEGGQQPRAQARTSPKNGGGGGGGGDLAAKLQRSIDGLHRCTVAGCTYAAKGKRRIDRASSVVRVFHSLRFILRA